MYWMKVLPGYPDLAIIALKTFLPFPTSYLSESRAGLPNLLFAKGPNLVQKQPKKSQILRQEAKKIANHFFQSYQQ